MGVGKDVVSGKEEKGVVGVGLGVGLGVAYEKGVGKCVGLKWV